MNIRFIQQRVEKARGHILSGKPAEALAVLQAVADSLDQAKMSASEAARLRAAFAELHILAAAAGEGVAKARQDITAIMAESESSLTYDRHGRVRRVSAGAGKEQHRM